MDVTNEHGEIVICGTDVQDKWRGRSKLEQTLIIALVIVSLVLFGVLLFIIINHAAAPKICTTSACILAASQIVSHIDPSADPCDDFFQFACGNFIKSSHGDLKASSIKEIEEDVQRQLAELIREPIREDENPWIKSQKIMFQACMNETAVEEESLAIFKKTLEQLDGWPVVKGYQWNENIFDWKYLNYKLRERGYPHSILLDVGIEIDPVDKSRFIVSVFPPHVSKITDEHKRLYKSYMTDVAVLFGAERNRAANEMEKVFDFRENLRKIYGGVYEPENKNETVNYTAIILEGRMTVKKYQELNADVEWLDFINILLHPVGKVTSDDYVIFPKLEFTEPFFRLIYLTNRRIVANYIIWMVIEEIMPYMSKDLKQRSANYSCLIHGPPTESNRYEFCKNEIKKSIYGPLSIMYARKYLPIDQRKKVEEMLANVKLEFISALQEASWMDSESKTKTVEKAKDVVGIIGAPGDYFNDAVFQQLLGDNYTEIENGSYFTMLLKQQKLQTDSLYFKMHMNVNDTKLDGYYQLISQVNAMYSTEDNVIIIPVGILQGVFYNADRPMYMNYGAMGSIIGHELTHGFGELGSEYEKNGYSVQMWTNATRKAYKENTECIVKEADEFMIEHSELEINGTATLEENLADYTGLKVSYAAYKKWMQQNGKEPKLPEISYTPNQLFWISAVSYECFKINKYSQAKKDTSHAHNSFRVTAPLRNNRYFGKDFNCPIGSKMNPPKKCQVF